jgi:protein-S-isoprenylcysteine O-methyltransferase Ste14
LDGQVGFRKDDFRARYGNARPSIRRRPGYQHMSRRLKAAAMTAIAVAVLVATVALTWLSVQPIKYAFREYGMTAGFVAAGIVIVLALIADRLIDRSNARR